MRRVSQLVQSGLIFVSVILSLCTGAVAHENKVPWKITEDTARRLAAEGDHGAATGLDYFDPDNNGGPFFVFHGLTKPPVEGSFGYFAVNPWTGDVWNLWGCRRLSSAALRKSQAEIRRRFTTTELKQYEKLRRLKPECIVEN